MEASILAQREKLSVHLIKQLGLRRMAASYCATAQQAKAELLKLIPTPASVIRCGSESAAARNRRRAWACGTQSAPCRG